MVVSNGMWGSSRLDLDVAGVFDAGADNCYVESIEHRDSFPIVNNIGKRLAVLNPNMDFSYGHVGKALSASRVALCEGPNCGNDQSEYVLGDLLCRLEVGSGAGAGRDGGIFVESDRPIKGVVEELGGWASGVCA